MSFTLAAVVHWGGLVQGYAYQPAAIAESTIAGVLLVGLVLTLIWPASARLIGLAAETFALLGTLIGLFTIVVGVGPRTGPDLAFHLAILVVLILGLIVVVRSAPESAARGSSIQPWALAALEATSYLALLLVFAQAVLAGEWLAGQEALMRIHLENGSAILIVALAQVVLVVLAGLEGRRRMVLAGSAVIFFLLVLIQEMLGYAGFESANQARALHVANGVLVFGVALVNVQLSRHLRRLTASRRSLDG